MSATILIFIMIGIVLTMAGMIQQLIGYEIGAIFMIIGLIISGVAGVVSYFVH